MVHETREGCPSDRHDSRRAFKLYGCTCPASTENARTQWRNWRESPRGQAAAARIAQRRREEREWYRTFVSGRGARLDTVRRLTLAGESSASIAVRVGVTQRTVVRWRAKLRQDGLLNVS